MKWSAIVDKVNKIDAGTLKSILEDNSAAFYLLIDVRQPGEYAKSRIPGAVSMPLNELVEGNIILPEKKPLFIYSRSGIRSKAAAQWFISQGFSEVTEIEGGFDQWQGNHAFGRFEMNLQIVNQNVDFPDAFRMSYAMEEGLRRFYLEIAKETLNPFFQKLYRRLASFEVEHKQALAAAYAEHAGLDVRPEDFERQQLQLLEGGGYLDETLIQTLSNTASVHDVFSLAIAFETQAFDFYIRLSRYADNPEAKNFFLEMADAEKAHLALVTQEMDAYLNQESL